LQCVAPNFSGANQTTQSLYFLFHWSGNNPDLGHFTEQSLNDCSGK